MGVTDCRVWDIFQARCLLCGWSAEVTDSRDEAVEDARGHRAGPDHQKKLALRRKRSK